MWNERDSRTRIDEYDIKAGTKVCFFFNSVYFFLFFNAKKYFHEFEVLLVCRYFLNH